MDLQLRDLFADRTKKMSSSSFSAFSLRFGRTIAVLFRKPYINIGVERKREKSGDSMNKKTTYAIAAIVVIIIIIAAVAAYVLYTGGGGGGGATPTASPTPTATAASVVGATTLQFNVNETTNGALVTYEFQGKNVNTSSVELRLNIPGGAAGNYTYIINAGAETSYVSMDNGATWTASNFVTDWTSLGAIFESTVTQLQNWNGVDATYSYTSTTGSSIVVYNIVVNPTLPDSLFTTS